MSGASTPSTTHGASLRNFLIFNRIIGTGVGIALLMWVLGALIAIAGTTVYVELGKGLPRSGGEKNYLEYIYRRPNFMASCTYGLYTLIAGSSAPNGIVFGEYLIHALALPPTPFNTRLAALLVLTFSLLMIGVFNKWGVRLLNTLGTFKFGILAGIAALGLLSLLGVSALAVRPEYDAPQGPELACYSVVRDPVRTIKRAAPLAILSVATVYMLVNIGYFGVVSKNDILGSRQIVPAANASSLHRTPSDGSRSCIPPITLRTAQLPALVMLFEYPHASPPFPRTYAFMHLSLLPLDSSSPCADHPRLTVALHPDHPSTIQWLHASLPSMSSFLRPLLDPSPHCVALAHIVAQLV
ncbi:amino acid permease-domain-containing protein [Mycena leptocephala]|nr:amino acid permease-domain-containing protein [Mycena leptocephala]